MNRVSTLPGARPERRVAAAAEDPPDALALLVLHEDEEDEQQRADHEQHEEHDSYQRHGTEPSYRSNRTMGTNVSAFSDAPPTRAPSMFGIFIRAAALSGFTEPPYWITSASAAAAVYSPATTARMVRCTASASSGVAFRPVPMAHTGS